MDVSIIIVNYHTAYLIVNLLASIQEYTKEVQYEVIVVDNDPSTEEKFILAPYFSKFRYVPLAQNVGFGRANNEGLKVAKGRNIFFLNPDTLIVENAIDQLVDFLEQHPEVGVCGANLYDRQMQPIHSFMRSLPSPVWELNSLLGNCIFKKKYGKNIQHNFTNHPMKVGYITGADMLIRKEILEEVGGFDPDFFMYFEETELTYRISKHGYSSFSVPSAKIIHLEGQSCETSDKREKMKSVSKRLYYKKTSNMFLYYLSNALLFVNCCLRILFAKLRGKQDAYQYWILIFKNI